MGGAWLGPAPGRPSPPALRIPSAQPSLSNHGQGLAPALIQSPTLSFLTSVSQSREHRPILQIEKLRLQAGHRWKGFYSGPVPMLPQGSKPEASRVLVQLATGSFFSPSSHFVPKLLSTQAVPTPPHTGSSSPFSDPAPPILLAHAQSPLLGLLCANYRII